jgi:hypothetical protein
MWGLKANQEKNARLNDEAAATKSCGVDRILHL